MTTTMRASQWLLVLAIMGLGLWLLVGRRSAPLLPGQAALRAGRAFHEFCVKESLKCDGMEGRGLGKPIVGGGFQFEFASSEGSPAAIILVDVLPEEVSVRPERGVLEHLRRRR